MDIISVSFLGAACGLFGALTMNIFMRAVARKWGKRGDMVRALGRFFGRSKESAASIGTAIHGGAGVIFGVVYFLTMDLMGALTMPYAIFLGIGFGFIHGMLVSYVLMYYASERHPDEEFRKATMEEGVIHLVGHVLFGLVVGLLGGLLGMAFA